MKKIRTKRPRGVVGTVFLAVGVLVPQGLAEKATTKEAATRARAAEQLAEKNLAAAHKNPLQLRHFLLGMPKGADLHYHLSGGIYAESFLRAAAEDHLCVNVK